MENYKYYKSRIEHTHYAGTAIKNIKHKPLPMFITNRDDNSPAKFAEEVIAQFAIQQGISETKVNDWKLQLKLAECEGRFAYTNMPILTYAFLN